MDILIKAAQLMLALVILVTIHEFGHYLFARLFGVKVNRFYLFFNPSFSLLRYNPRKGTLEIIAGNDKDGNPKALATLRLGKEHPAEPDSKPTWRDTIYGLGWVPLGGYCDIAGMIDETKDASTLESEPQNWEFRSKPAWQRLFVMIGGVTFNFILAICVYIGIAFHWGDDVVPFQAMTEGMDFAPELIEAGFQNGDILTSLNGKALEATDYSIQWDMLQPGANVGVIRNGVKENIIISDTLLRKLVAKGNDYIPMSMRVPVYVAKALPGDPAAEGGIKVGDHILTVGADTVPSISEFMPTLQKYKGQSVEMKIARDNSADTVVNVNISDGGKIGIQMLSPYEIFDHHMVKYSFFESIPRGWEIGTTQLSNYVSSLGLIFTKEGAQSLGGFGTLGDLFPSHWNWYGFWQITAFLSIILAIMNIIPIPGLDGGHTLFLLVEMATRRRPSDRFLEIANTAGFVFLLILLLYANGNDIYRFFIK